MSVSPIPPPHATLLKEELRRSVRSRLNGLTPEQRADAARKAMERMTASPLWQQTRNVLLFAPLPREIDLWPLVALALTEGKRVALPWFNAESGVFLPREIRRPTQDLVSGAFGVREPNSQCPLAPMEELDFVLAPGIAFDHQGVRLGRGKGYYDRMLEKYHGVICGTGFDEQWVPSVPWDPHDVRVHWILTPSRLVPRTESA